MRRPLTAALCGAAAAVWLTILFVPWGPRDYEPFRGSCICLEGTVCGLEQKLKGDGTVWRMMLSDISAAGDSAPAASADVSAGEADRGSASAVPAEVSTREGDSASAVSADISAREADRKPAVSADISAGEGGGSPDAAGGAFPDLGPEECVLCVLEREPALQMSARVRVRGKVVPFRGAMNEGEFDARLYYHILRVGFSLRDAQILAVSAPADRPAAFLYLFKKTISNTIDRLFSIRNAPVLKAMLLGEKGLLDEETKELYQGAGIIHILSVSGLHLSLIGMGLFSVLEKFRVPAPARTAASTAVVFLYSKMTGMGTSAFRAVVMLSLYLIAKAIGRTYDLLTAASIAWTLLLIDQPLYLYHTGFLFSFSAVLSMGILLPALPTRTLKVLAVPLGTLPVYLWSYGTFPPYSLALNLLVIPLMGAVMLSGGAAVLLGGVLAAVFGGAGMGAAGFGGMGMGAAASAPTLALAGEGAGMLSGNAAGFGGLLPALALAGEGTGALSGSAAGFGGLLPARAAGLPAELILDLYRFLAGICEKLPGSTIVIGRPSVFQILIYYGLLLVLAGVSGHLRSPAVKHRLEHPVAAAGGSAPGAAGLAHGAGGRYKPTHPVAGASGPAPGAAVSARGSVFRRFLYGGYRMSRHFPPLIDRLASRFFRDNRERRLFGTACSAGWLFFAVAVLTFRIPPSFEMDVLYVGQGDGIFITSGGRNYLIDGGSTSNEELAKYTLIPFLHCRGIRRLDAVLITHEDRDHCSAVLELLEKAAGAAGDASGIAIDAVCLPDIGDGAKGDNYHEIETLAAAARVPVYYIGRGDRLRSGDLSLTCLHPEKGAVYEEANEYSLTLLLEYGEKHAPVGAENSPENGLAYSPEDSQENRIKAAEKDGTGNGGKNPAGSRKGRFSALLTGDLEGQGEADLTEYIKDKLPGGSLCVDLLKVAHHGSRGATGEAFLDLVDFDTAVISAGINNRYGHPHRELLERLDKKGAACRRTDREGEISCCLRGIKSKVFLRGFWAQGQ